MLVLLSMNKIYVVILDFLRFYVLFHQNLNNLLRSCGER